MLKINRGAIRKLNVSSAFRSCLGGSIQTTKNYSTKDSSDAIDVRQPKKGTSVGDIVADTSSSTPAPWYLTMVDRNQGTEEPMLHTEVIELPPNSPQSLTKIAAYLKDKLGISSILVFDLRDTDKANFTTAVAKVSDFMIIGTAKSAKHCQKCFTELNGFIKRQFNSIAYVEGNINAREEKKRQKRIARKSNLGKSWGSNSSPYANGFQNSSEAWFMIDCHVDNIFVNVLTEQRRTELNLEELYAPQSERFKYQRKNEKSHEELDSANFEDDLKEENNVLAGLRKLAYQKRHYSTLPLAAELNRNLSESLKNQNFPAAFKIIENPNLIMDNHLSLSLLHTVADAFAVQEVPVAKTKNLKDWKELFDRCWPLVLPSATASLHWSVRLKFLKMLNIANAKYYPVGSIVDDYLLMKRSMGYPLVRDDFLQFLQIVIINLNLSPKADYWDLVNKNGDVVKALQLFDELNDESLIKDELVVSMLLKTMVLNDEKRTRLHALYEVVDFLMANSKGGLSPTMIATTLEILGGIKDWNKFFQFWEFESQSLLPGQDYRPWDEFLKIIVNSNDITLMNKIVNEGHLLWLKRNEVEITKELESQLNKLFSKVDPRGIIYQTLKDYLLT